MRTSLSNIRHDDRQTASGGGPDGHPDSLEMRRARRVWVAKLTQLSEGGYLKRQVLYAGTIRTVVVFRCGGVVRAYLNLCVHMPRELDGEANTIFDASRERLRCSMHGIVYNPETGESLSTMCTGQRLSAVRLEFDQQGIWIRDNRVRPINSEEDRFRVAVRSGK